MNPVGAFVDPVRRVFLSKTPLGLWLSGLRGFQACFCSQILWTLKWIFIQDAHCALHKCWGGVYRHSGSKALGTFTTIRVHALFTASIIGVCPGIVDLEITLIRWHQVASVRSCALLEISLYDVPNYISEVALYARRGVPSRVGFLDPQAAETIVSIDRWLLPVEA